MRFGCFDIVVVQFSAILPTYVFYHVHHYPFLDRHFAGQFDLPGAVAFGRFDCLVLGFDSIFGFARYPWFAAGNDGPRSYYGTGWPDPTW